MTKPASPLRDLELVEMLSEEPELLAIADALVATAEQPVSARRRRTVFLVGMPSVAAAALAATLLVLLWPFGSSPSVLDNALAAIGSRPVTHVVLETDLGAYLLDLRTGKRTPTAGREEIWYQPTRGLLAEWSFQGKPSGTFSVPHDETLSVGTSYDYVSQFILSYRSKLRAHAFRVTHSGRITGVPVYWLNSRPTYIGHDPSRKQVQQVAVSKRTYKPIYFRSLYNNRIVPGSGERVLSIETTNTAPPALGAHGAIVQTRYGFGWDLGYAPIPFSQARAQQPRPILPRAIAGLRLSWTGNSPFITGPNGVVIPGVCLYYGSVIDTGIPNDKQPSFKGRYVEIVEFAGANRVTRFYAGRFPSDGVALINGLPAQGPVVDDASAHVATLRTNHGYVLIQASTDTLAIKTAQALSG